jgi:hypothetical protein
VGIFSGSKMEDTTGSVICPLDVDPRKVVLIRAHTECGVADARLLDGRLGKVHGKIHADLGRWARALITSGEAGAVFLPLSFVCEHVECELNGHCAWIAAADGKAALVEHGVSLSCRDMDSDDSNGYYLWELCVEIVHSEQEDEDGDENETAPVEYVHGDAFFLATSEPDEGEADERGDEVAFALLSSDFLSKLIPRLESQVDLTAWSFPEGGWSYGEKRFFSIVPQGAAVPRRILCKL